MARDRKSEAFPFLKNIPDEPGIYKMLDPRHVILYVGKAKNLKKRILSYYSQKAERDPKTTLLLKTIASIETIVTRTEKEALILENQLIKTYQPRYNFALKDDKNYPYLKITVQDPFPRVLIVRQKTPDGSRYFGPYPSIGSTRRLYRLLHELFPIRDCKQTIDLVTLQPKCVKLDIGRCMGPCVYKNVKSYYEQCIQDIILFLSGKNKQLVGSLRKQMRAYSEACQFEKAAKLRDKIVKIETLTESQFMELEQGNFQIWTDAENSRYYYILIQTYREGKLMYQGGHYAEKKSEYRKENFIMLCLQSIFENADEIPSEILSTPQLSGILKRLDFSGSPKKIRVLAPQKGMKREVVNLAEKNAKIALNRINSVDDVHSDSETECQRILRLKRRPDRIFGIDISHLQGQDIVSSCVAFEKGKPKKSLYRKFLIRSTVGKSHDPGSIYETVKRRMILCQGKGEQFPQMLLIDGGRAQHHFASKALEDLHLMDDVDVVALAKRKEEVYLAGSALPLRLPRHHGVLRLLQRIRDEAHRFALEYQKKKRSRRYKDSILYSIKGLGEKRIGVLYHMYHTIARMAEVSPEELAKIGKIGYPLALRVLERIR